MYALDLVVAPPGAVSATSTAPAAWAGVVSVTLLLLVTVRLVASMPPTVTCEVPDRLVPVIVSSVPPAVVPVDGLMLVIVGDGGLGAA